MRVLYILVAVLSLPATGILSSLFWRGMRESRAIGMLLNSPDFLRRVVTAELLNDPPAEVARFAQPHPAGYALNMRIFREADRAAHSRARTLLRPALVIVVIASGIVGFLGVGWWGLVFPIVNVFILFTTGAGSIQRNAIDSESAARATEHVQIIAVILQRWCAQSPREAREWIGESQMTLLGEHLDTLQTR